jgi:hypothetical protein
MWTKTPSLKSERRRALGLCFIVIRGGFGIYSSSQGSIEIYKMRSGGRRAGPCFHFRTRTSLSDTNLHTYVPILIY